MTELSNLTIRRLIKEAIIKKDVKAITKTLFGIDLAPMQEQIVRKIAYAEDKRLVICCMTRYGKTYCVAIGTLLYLLFHEKKRIMLVAPTYDQTSIIRNYISNFMAACPLFYNMLELTSDGGSKGVLDRIKREVSKSRMTFTDGSELKVLSAANDGKGLMGFGGDMVICVPKNTLIASKYGNISIQNLTEGMEVYSFNDGWGVIESRKILRCHKNSAPKELIEISLDGGCLICTPNHPILTKDKGWLGAENLCVNDKIYKYDCYSNKYANNKLSNMRKPILQETEPHSQNSKTNMQQQMCRNSTIKKQQHTMVWGGNKKNLPSMPKRISGKKGEDSQSQILFSKLQNNIQERKPRSTK